MFKAIPFSTSMKKLSLKIKNSDLLKYTPSWKRSSRTPVLCGEKYPIKSAKPPATELLSRTSLSRVGQNTTDSRVSNKDIQRVAEKQKENIELNRSLSIEITGQLPAQKDIFSEVVTDLDETKSLEIVLSYRGSINYRRNELNVWPHDLTFKDDKHLIYNAVDNDLPGDFKEPQPRRSTNVDLVVKPSTTVVEKSPPSSGLASNIPSRIAELFKEQWLSPFSVFYMTKILSVFYSVDFEPNRKAEVPPASSLGLCYELNPSIQNAFKKSLKRRSRELQKLDGPVSFSSLHRLSGKNAVQSNLPVQPILIGADGDYVSVAPNCLKSWRKLFLEPFSGSRDVAYVVVAPDTDLVLENTKQFFKELSVTYEVCIFSTCFIAV